MAPGKWDDEEAEDTPPSSPPAITTRRGKFDDEEEDDVLDSWDAAEDSEVEREKAKKAAEAKAKADAEAKANKKSRTARIAEHQTERKKKAAEEEDEESSEEEDETTRRRRLLAEQRKADLDHAGDLLGDDGGSGEPAVKQKAITITDPKDPSKSVDLSSLSIFNPNTKNQFSELRDTVGPLIGNNYKKAQYSLFMQEFSKLLCKEMPSDQIKKIASGLTTLSNERMKEEKAAEKGGKKSKASKTKTTLNANKDVSNRADTSAYDDFDDDDFM